MASVPTHHTLTSTPHAIQHNPAASMFLKCSSDDITLQLKLFQGLPTTTSQIKCTVL